MPVSGPPRRLPLEGLSVPMLRSVAAPLSVKAVPAWHCAQPALANTVLPAVGRRGERAVAVRLRALHERRQRLHVGGERIEVRAHAGLRVAERLAARAGVEGRIAHQAGAAGERADLAFEVLHLVEVARSSAGSPARRRGPAARWCCAGLRRGR